MSGDKKIRVGSRKSELALIQTRHVISLLKEINPGVEFEIVTMSTLGDKVLDIPLPKIGEKSLFTKELETALATGCVNFVVHSLKDLPTVLPSGMAIGAVLTREDPRDALVLHEDHSGKDLSTLPKDSTIGTSSLRRTAQLAKKYPHLKVENIRGNLNTRLKKLDELGKYQGLVLAVAGLYRMGWHHRISKVIDCNDLLYAVGQGALAVECRENDEETIALLRPLYDLQTALQIIAERTFLKTLGGGCSAPVAVRSSLDSDQDIKHKLSLQGAVWSLDGQEEIIEEDSSTLDIAKFERCAACPYNTNKTTTPTGSCSQNTCTKTDIECLHECSFKQKESQKCPFKQGGGPSKKPKLNDSTDRANSISVDLLKDDPHEHCPIDIPVGLDFMGKCPYLDKNIVNLNTNKCPVNGEILGETKLNIDKCPFMNSGQLQIICGNNSKSEDSKKIPESTPKENSNLFCGLVSHPDISIETFKEAEYLGSRLAKKLMAKGATEIMAKAQAHIRNS